MRGKRVLSPLWDLGLYIWLILMLTHPRRLTGGYSDFDRRSGLVLVKNPQVMCTVVATFVLVVVLAYTLLFTRAGYLPHHSRVESPYKGPDY